MLADPITLQRAREAFAAYVEPLQPLLANDRVTDIMLNAPRVPGEPGEVWIDVAGEGLQPTGITMTADEAENFIRHVGAHAAGMPVLDAERPVLTCQAAMGQLRVEALIPPAVQAPVFTIRKYIARNVRLADYVRSGELTAAQADFLGTSARTGKTILLSGETCSGKTTLLNALLPEAAADAEGSPRRLLLVEDTPELEVPAGPSQRFEVPPNGTFTYAAAIKSALRMRPNSIVLGEIRDGDAAFCALRACRTGHQGLSTIHAASCQGSLWELYSLCRQTEQGKHILERTVSDAVEACVHLHREHGRRVIDVQRVRGWDAAAGEYALEAI